MRLTCNQSFFVFFSYGKLTHVSGYCKIWTFWFPKPIILIFFIFTINVFSDGMLRVCGQLASLSVSDLSPNGSLYRERFIFTGDKALDFDIKKFDEYDQNLDREFDISVQLRMSSIRYVHTQRFQNETVAYCQHFQQLQEVSLFFNNIDFDSD